MLSPSSGDSPPSVPDSKPPWEHNGAHTPPENQSFNLSLPGHTGVFMAAFASVPPFCFFILLELWNSTSLCGMGNSRSV
ncbi:unnamed protein product [Linum tenue]|uniref:Uncharacterized protein n=1 Tax=Linum tenue TaxID=586396 RepID=A0AAV0NLE3_9ROSI|nr:unnamed protein product [Linum tenue]